MRDAEQVVQLVPVVDTRRSSDDQAAISRGVGQALVHGLRRVEEQAVPHTGSLVTPVLCQTEENA